MRSCRLCALASMLVVAADGSPASARSAQDPPLVRLALVDLYGLTPDVGVPAAAEAAAVLDRLGARTEVRWKLPSDPDDPRDLLVVVMPGDPGRLLEANRDGRCATGRAHAHALGLPEDDRGRPRPVA